MNRRLTKLSELQATLLILGIVGVVLVALSSIGFFFEQPGWMIGVAIGTLATFVNAILVDIGSTATLRDEKTAIYLLAYFVRMIVFVGLFAMLAFFDFKLKYVAFKNSCWGMFIGFIPSTLVTIVVQMKHESKPTDGKDGQVH